MQVVVMSFQGRLLTRVCRQLKLQVQPCGKERIWVSVFVRDERWRRAGGGRWQVEVDDGFWS